MVMVQNHATRPLQELPLVGPIAPIRFVGHPITGFNQEMSEVVSFFESSGGGLHGEMDQPAVR